MSDDWIDKIPTEFRKKPDMNSSAILWVAGILLVAGALLTMIYTVPFDSTGVVMRFGKFTKVESSGLKVKMPFGIDQVHIVANLRQLKQEFGFGTQGGTNPTQYSRNPEPETRMVTGDLNSALVQWVVQYRIENVTNFLFAVRRPEGTLRHVSESVMREVVGDRTVDEVLTIGRQEIEAEAQVRMSDLARKYAIGVSIDQVQLKDVNPPQPVQSSFNEVNQAQQEKEKLINEARREYNRVVPLAEGEKDQRIEEAEGYRLQRINEAEGDVAAFRSVLAEFLKAPEVTQRRLYLEAMQEVLPRVRNKIVVDEDATSVLPLLNLNSGKGAK